MVTVARSAMVWQPGMVREIEQAGLGYLQHLVVITSDNPRSEDPQRIIDDVKRGSDA